MAKRILTALIISVMCAANVLAAGKFTLVIDAGHGGHDAGAIGRFSKEKDINLNTALAFGRYVERNCPDVNVIYTRKTDVFVTLSGRAEIANKAKADLFISIHTNALPNGKIGKGLETYTLGMHRAGDNLDIAKRENSVILVEKDYKQRYQGFDPNSSESYIIFEFMQDNNMQKSVELARLVQSNVCSSAGRPDKGVKQAGFLVLRETSMPSCLIELGFISTPEEEKLLNDPASIDKMGLGIYKAFLTYKRKYDANGVPVEKAKPAANASTEPVKTVAANNGKSSSSEVSSSSSAKKKSKKKKTVEEKKEEAPKVEPVKPAEPAKKEEQPKPVEPVKKTEPVKPMEPVKKEETMRQQEPPKEVLPADKPVFRVQILASEQQLAEDSPRFKGEKNIYIYKEGGMQKYTIGESTDYNEIYRLRKTLLEKFPDCFIIAFKNGEKMNIVTAIKEFKAQKAP